MMMAVKKLFRHYLHSFSSDDPVEAKRLKDEHEKHNQEVIKMLNEKGFDKFTINMFLSAGMDKRKK